MKWLIMLLFSVTLQSHSREYTKPPSIALRTEVSYVSLVTLNDKVFVSPDSWRLHFSLVADIHNQSKEQVSILVDNTLAKNLEENSDHIIAYQTHKKVKNQGLVEYIALPDGPQLLLKEGANPAIFQSTQILKEHLNNSPNKAKESPQEFIKDLLKGMKHPDPKIQEFFVRELINWPSLHSQLNPNHFRELSDIYQSNTLSSGSFTAFIENRDVIHKSIGVKNMAPKVMGVLQYHPTELDVFSNQPSLILQALDFAKIHQLGDWNLFHRWMSSNVSSVSEKALLICQKIDHEKTLDWANKKRQDSEINETTRRVLLRFVSKN